MDKHGYPEEDELEKIKKWDYEDILGLLEYLKSLWHWQDWGFKLKEKKTIFSLELHTGGWSGNEKVIGALKENVVFWLMCWQKSCRGGHYYFQIRKNSSNRAVDYLRVAKGE